MSIVRRLMKGSIIRILLLAAVLIYTLSGIPETYDMWLEEIVFQEADSPDQVRLMVSGANLIRVNSFYLDGEHIRDAVVEKMNYSQCAVTIDKRILEAGKWHRMEMGFSKWRIIRLLSSPVWVQWMD